MNTPKSISIIVPVFQSRDSINALYHRCCDVLNKITDDWEIICVDDASKDNSWEELCKINKLDPRFKCIRLSYNHGQQHSTLCGLGYAQKDYVITIDDDLQCYPEEIPLFVEKLQSGKKVVIGKISYYEKKHSFFRKICSRINLHLINKVINNTANISLSSFRGMTNDVAKILSKYKGAHPHISAMIFKSVPRNFLCNVNIRHSERLDNKNSTYTISKLFKTLSYLLINHSYIPLRIMVVWGFIISGISFIYGCYVLIRVVFGDTLLPGWASSVILVSFLSGNILLALGVIGEYLGRLVEEASSIQQFSIFDSKGLDELK